MGAENLTGNLPNKVQGQYQRPLPREFENGNIGDVSWKDENGALGWVSNGVLPKAISVADFSSAPLTTADGDVYIGTTDTSAVHADWGNANKYDWVRYTADTSSWGAVTPQEGVLCFDSSASEWLSSDTSANGWNTLQEKVGAIAYTTQTINISDWDMDTTTNVVVAHGLSATEWKTIRNINAIIRNDADTEYSPLDSKTDTALGAGMNGGIDIFDSSDVYLVRMTGGQFDGVNYNSTSYNRGWITFEYIKD